MALFDWSLLEVLEQDGIDGESAHDLVDWLEDQKLIEREADSWYRVMPDGVIAVSELRKRNDAKERTMEQKLTDLETREAERLRLLDAVYEMTEGNTHAYVSLEDAYKRANLDHGRGTAAYQYLSLDDLLLGQQGNHVSITHAGVKEREAAIRGRGQAPTRHFSQPAVNHVVQTFHGPVGVVQAGGRGNVATVTSTSNPAAGALVDAIARMRESAHAMPAAERDAALEHIEKLHVAAHADKPDTVRMKVWLQMLETFGPLTKYIPAVVDALSNIGA